MSSSGRRGCGRNRVRRHPVRPHGRAAVAPRARNALKGASTWPFLSLGFVFPSLQVQRTHGKPCGGLDGGVLPGWGSGGRPPTPRFGRRPEPTRRLVGGGTAFHTSKVTLIDDLSRGCRAEAEIFFDPAFLRDADHRLQYAVNARVEFGVETYRPPSRRRQACGGQLKTQHPTRKIENARDEPGRFSDGPVRVIR